jgi:antibiotic biosynthesis monooxygenase (ABM) superfamily enzyme
MSIARTVVAGRESDYEIWLKGITADAVKYPGHMGVNVLRPRANDKEYGFLGPNRRKGAVGLGSHQ